MGKKVTVRGKNKKGKSTVASEEDHRVQILQMALAEAIDENQVLRKRVCELEALLVAAQMRFEQIAEREERKEGRQGQHFEPIRIKRPRMAKS